MEQRISLITLGVSDKRRAIDFYAALGWEGSSPDGDITLFQAGGMIVALWGREQLAEDTGVADSGGWGGITLAQLVRSPEDVDALLERATAAGAELLRAGAATPWGGYSGVFRDPDGHAWEIAHNPFWSLAEDGTVTLGA